MAGENSGPSKRELYEACLTGAQDRPYIPRLRSDPPSYQHIPHSLREFRAQEGPDARDRRLRDLWSRLPQHNAHHEDDESAQLAGAGADGPAVLVDGALTAETAKGMQAMYEAELRSRCGAHTSGFLHRGVSWSEFRKYADAKEAGMHCPAAPGRSWLLMARRALADIPRRAGLGR